MRKARKKVFFIVADAPTSPGRKQRRNGRSPSPEPPRLPSPSKRVMRPSALATPGATRIPELPAYYRSCLRAQKQAIMTALRNPPELDTEDDRDETPSTNELGYDDLCGLCDLLTGSVVRSGGSVVCSEGNNRSLIEPRGSGKTRVRLCVFPETVLDDEEDEGNEEEMDQRDISSLPPPACLPSLISVLPSQPKPLVITLDAFYELVLHGRQALVYCLLDTVQSCRVGSGLNIECVEMLNAAQLAGPRRRKKAVRRKEARGRRVDKELVVK